MDSIKELLTDLIGTDTTAVVDGILVPDYAFLISGLLLCVFVFVLFKGVFALCKRH